MCECLKQMEEKCKEQIMRQNNIKEESIENAEFDNAYFLFNCETSRVLGNKYELTHYRTKTNGERYKSKSIEKINLMPKYCQFCGEEFKLIKKVKE